MVFDPTVGHEQAGRRPALVLSEKDFSLAADIAIVCPITSKIRGVPSEIVLTGTKTRGAVLSTQVKSMDISNRKVVFIEQAPDKITEQTAKQVAVFIGIEVPNF